MKFWNFFVTRETNEKKKESEIKRFEEGERGGSSASGGSSVAFSRKRDEYTTVDRKDYVKNSFWMEGLGGSNYVGSDKEKQVKNPVEVPTCTHDQDNFHLKMWLVTHSKTLKDKVELLE